MAPLVGESIGTLKFNRQDFFILSTKFIAY